MDISLLEDVVFFQEYSSFFCNCAKIGDNMQRCSCYAVSVSEAVVLLALAAFVVALAVFLLKRKVFA